MDFRLASNRGAVALPLLAGVVAGWWALAAGWGLGEAMRAGVGAGGGSFLAWATAREIDPDHPVTAVAAAVAAPWAVLVGPPALAAVFLWMLAVRAVVGSTGSAPYLADMLFVGGLGVWTALGDRGLAAALGGLAVVAASTVFDGRGRSLTLTVAAVAMAVAAGAAVVVGGSLGPSPASSAQAWLVSGVAVVGLAALRVRTSSPTDRRPDRAISTARVRWGIGATTALGILSVAWHGSDGVTAAAPILVALGATAVSATLRAS
jgi:hypothetical protein